MTGSRGFRKGDTIVLTVYISLSSNAAPADVNSVAIESCTLNGVMVPISSYVFDRVSVGQYQLSLDSATLDLGTYTVVVLATGVNTKSSLKEQFVLLE